MLARPSSIVVTNACCSVSLGSRFWSMLHEGSLPASGAMPPGATQTSWPLPLAMQVKPWGHFGSLLPQKNGAPLRSGE
jgi:hypothetical protein